MSESELKAWLRGFQRLSVVGIGNPLRKDDYVGMKIVKDLKGKVPKRVMLIESETVPESFLGQIMEFEPTHVLLIDAAVMGEKPGTAKTVDCSELPNFSPVSSHALPLRIFCQYLRDNLNAAILLLLIEPKETDFGEGLSPEISLSARGIDKALIDLLSHR